jgi:hypothetical protein
LDRHIAIHHSKNAKRHHCPESPNRSFSQPGSLVRHLKGDHDWNDEKLILKGIIKQLHREKRKPTGKR